MDRLTVKADGGLTIDMDASYDFDSEGCVNARYKYKYAIDQGGTNTVDVFIEASASGFYAASDQNLTIHLDRQSIVFDKSDDAYRLNSQTKVYDHDANLEMMMEKQLGELRQNLQKSLALALSQPMKFTNPELKGKKLTLRDSDGSTLTFKRK